MRVFFWCAVFASTDEIVIDAEKVRAISRNSSCAWRNRAPMRAARTIFSAACFERQGVGRTVGRIVASLRMRLALFSCKPHRCLLSACRYVVVDARTIVVSAARCAPSLVACIQTTRPD